MPAKTYQQIRDEADRLFGSKSSQQKFEWRRQQQAAAGLAQEKRQRGGMAEVWDRNKRVITPVAELIAGYFGGAPAAAATGALIKGVDRPGKRGIGFDVGRAARGGLEGYGVGGIGATARGAVSPGMAGMSHTVPAGRVEGAAKALQSYYTPGAQALVTGAQKTLEFAQKNPAIVAQALQTGLGTYQAAQAAELEKQQADLAEELRRQEQERKNRLARLLAPAMQATASPYLPSR